MTRATNWSLFQHGSAVEEPDQRRIYHLSSGYWPTMKASLVILIVLLLSASLDSAFGQITLDGSMGAGGALTGPNFTIPSSVGQTRGSNLFHSFGLFNVLTGQSATFTGPSLISNIFSRITGGQPSTIDGTIRSTIPNANLYLMNPAGMMFGPNASLDVQGSFHATTADYLKFADGAKFHADLTRQSVLTSAAVSAFGFLSQNPAAISVDKSSLQVPDGQTLSLVAGNITITGDPDKTGDPDYIPTLGAFQGQLQLASVASAGEVPVNVRDLGLGSFDRFGDISLSNTALVDSSGNGGGTVVIRGGQLVVDSSKILANNTGNVTGVGTGVDVAANSVTVKNLGAMISNTSGAGSAGSITVNARETVDVIGTGKEFPLDVLIDYSNSVNYFTGISSQAIDGSQGKAGSVTIDAKNVYLSALGRITSDTFGPGDAGTVKVSASETVDLTGRFSEIFSGSFDKGLGGNVTVNAKNIKLTKGGAIQSTLFGDGNGGDVTVTATDTVYLDNNNIKDLFTGIATQANHFPNSLPNGAGKAGSLTVHADKDVILRGGSVITSSTTISGDGGKVSVDATNVTLSDGSQIVSRSNGGFGNAGTVAIKAKETVALAGCRSDGVCSTIATNSTIFGDAGSVTVMAKNVALSGGTLISSDTSGSGNAGTVNVSAGETIALNSASRISTNTTDEFFVGSPGNGGDVVVGAKNVQLSGGATISSSTLGRGNGGNVTITGTSISLSQGATVSTKSTGTSQKINGVPGNAGNINLVVSSLEMKKGTITTGAAEATGGDITITHTGSILYLTNSQITTSVNGGGGKGGNITIGAELDSNLKLVKANPFDFIILNHSTIQANAFGGPGGNITILANAFFASPDSSITASSALSTPGAIDIKARFTDLTGSLTPLPEGIVQATSLLRDSCATRYSSSKVSSLAAYGRAATPFEPGGFLESSLVSLVDFSVAQDRSEPAPFIFSEPARFSIAARC